jgi:hypothetical protein
VKQRVAHRDLAEANLCMGRKGQIDDWQSARKNEKQSQNNNAMYE